MCGLAGRFRANGLCPAPGWAARADALLAHRGPDGAGHFSDPWVELVHRRLALQDLTHTGAQPMPNEDGTVQLVFNGEIYNHRELRRELAARGHRFRGTSDTEVIVHLYEEAGDAFAARLRGIFAFALYDARLGRLVLGRDRFGVKPLYYTGPSRDGEWVFASEIKAILAHPDFVPRLDRQACYDFLGLGFVPEPMTGFANVAALPPGTVLKVDAEGVHAQRFAQVHAQPDSGVTLDDAVEWCSRRLLSAVESQSAADVPVGALLSGGIDSSLVVAARSRLRRQDTDTFSVAFPDAAHDESAAAAHIAAHCGTRHHQIQAADHHLDTDTILGLLRHFDQPFADTSFLPTYWVSRAIRDRGFICALSGDGGDEGFGGYPRFWQAPRFGPLARVPAWALGAGRAVGAALQPYTRDVGRQIVRVAELAAGSRRDTSVLLAGLSTYLSESQKGALMMSREASDGLLPAARLFDGYSPAVAPDAEELSRRITETVFRVTLPGDMLRKVDMMSMRVGLEVRVPMLDDAVVDLGVTLPHRLKSDGRRGKLVLRALAERWLPPGIARLPKRGFSLPLDVLAPPSLHDALADYLDGPGARTRSVVARAPVRDWLHDFAASGDARRGGRVSRGGLHQRLLGLLSLELWMRDHRLAW